jgi:hypothetical protein
VTERAPEPTPAPVDDADVAAPANDPPDQEEQLVRDLGSASRSCTAIIVVALIVALLLCAFLVWASFIH